MGVRVASGDLSIGGQTCTLAGNRELADVPFAGQRSSHAEGTYRRHTSAALYIRAEARIRLPGPRLLPLNWIRCTSAFLRFPKLRPLTYRAFCEITRDATCTSHYSYGLAFKSLSALTDRCQSPRPPSPRHKIRPRQQALHRDRHPHAIA